jgi:hypothetical protein
MWKAPLRDKPVGLEIDLRFDEDIELGQIVAGAGWALDVQASSCQSGRS